MELREIPEAEVKQVERLMAGCLRQWKDHPDFEELLGMARLGFWQMMGRAAPDWWEQRVPLVRHVCRWAAWHFYRSPQNRFRKVNKHGQPVLKRSEAFDLERGSAFGRRDTVPDGAVEPGFALARREPGSGCEPDFAPRLIEHLWRQEVWQGVQATLSAEERALVWAWLSGVVTFGRQDLTGCTRMHRLLNRYRQQAGLPLKCGGGFGGRRQPLSQKPASVWRREWNRKNPEVSRAANRRYREKLKQREQDGVETVRDGTVHTQAG